MLDSKVRATWDRLIRPVGTALGRVVGADTITVLGLLIQAGVAVLIVQGRLTAAGLVAITSGIADVLDGAVAKARGTSSRFGAFLDSTVDRIGDALFFAPVAWLYGVSPDTPARAEPWVAAVALVALVASFLVSYVKARAQALGFSCDVGIAERAERYIVMVVVLVFDVVPAGVSLLAVLGVVTFLQRVEHVRRQARASDG